MARLSDLLSDVRTHLKSAPDPTCLKYLRRGARQFCQDSKVWHVRLGAKDVQAQTEGEELALAVPSTGADTDFALPAGSVISEISAVDAGTFVLEGRMYRYEFPTAMLVVAPGTLAVAATLEVFATLKPSRTAAELPDFLVDQWGEGISDHAIAEMMAMPGQDWSDPMLSRHFMSEYSQRTAEAATRRARGGTGRGIELPPIPFV